MEEPTVLMSMKDYKELVYRASFKNPKTAMLRWISDVESEYNMLHSLYVKHIQEKYPDINIDIESYRGRFKYVTKQLREYLKSLDEE